MRDQRSFLEPILFKIYFNQLFYLPETTDICNYTDDTTFQVSHSNLNSLVKRLYHNVSLSNGWFECNYLKLINGKCCPYVADNTGCSKILDSQSEKVLGVSY